MEEKKNNKKKIIIIVSILVLMGIIGGTLAYFMARATSSEQTITSANLKIVFDDSTPIINATDIEPIEEDDILTNAAKKTFRISKESNTGKDLYARIDLVDLNLSDNFKDYDLKWALYQGNNKLQEGTFNALDSKTEIPMINNILLDSTTPKEYSLYIWIRETDLEQERLMDGSLKGKISVIAEGKRTKYKDNSGANSPILAQGMIPVTYDEASEKWIKANDDERYYDYSSLMWANAVTVSETNRTTYQNAAAGTPIEMDDINSMWVWVPRYKYKIPSDIGTGTTANPILNPPQIDVVFESGTKTTGSSLSACPIDSTTCYYTHPAFRDGSKVYMSTPYDIGGWDRELEGIWVGKFETGTDNIACLENGGEDCINIDPIIKPDIVSLADQNISIQFDTSIKFAGGTRNTNTGEVTFAGNNKYGLTSSTDTHMEKNIEWGAIAYLSQSKYGKNGNTNYNETNKEIFINNSIYGYVGRSGGGPSESTPINGTYPNQTSTQKYISYGFYTYDDYLLEYDTNNKSTKVKGKGVGASTTGTIYGIYDMSGGTHEYVMANYFRTQNTGFESLSGFTSINYPGGNNGSKYYEAYKDSANSSGQFIKGDATWETMHWYSDISLAITESNSWFSRGGSASTRDRNGVFASRSVNGKSTIYGSFRSILIP